VPHPESGLPRRRLMRGVAWSVPVIAAASAAPGVAASCTGSMSTSGAVDPGTGGDGWDDWTLTNTGTTSWPIGSTLTWTVRNDTSTTDTFKLESLGFQKVTSTGASSLTLASGATGSFTFSLTSAIAVGATLRVAMSCTYFLYSSTFTLTGTGCTPIKACGNTTWNVYSTICNFRAVQTTAPNTAHGPRIPK